MNESCHTYEWVMAQVMRLRKALSASAQQMAQMKNRYMNVWLIHVWDIPHSYVWHDSFIRETWRIHMWAMTHLYMCHDAFICGTWHIHMCAMTHSYSCVWHDWIIRGTWQMNECRSYVCHATLIHLSCHTYISVMSHTRIWRSHGTHMNVSCPTYECVMSLIWTRYSFMVCHDPRLGCCFICVHLYCWYYSSVCVPWPIDRSDTRIHAAAWCSIGLLLFMCTSIFLTLLIHVCTMTH